MTWRLIPAAARSRLCSRVSAWVGGCVSQKRYVIGYYCEGYLLLLSFVSLKPLSFNLSIDVLSTKSRQMIKRYGANVSLCSTPATMSK